MEDLTNWLSVNKSWIFEGIGVVVILGVVRFFWKKKNGNQAEPTISNTAVGNKNIQAGGDVNINKEEKKK